VTQCCICGSGPAGLSQREFAVTEISLRSWMSYFIWKLSFRDGSS